MLKWIWEHHSSMKDWCFPITHPIFMQDLQSAFTRHCRLCGKKLKPKSVWLKKSGQLTKEELLKKYCPLISYLTSWVTPEHFPSRRWDVPSADRNTEECRLPENVKNVEETWFFPCQRDQLLSILRFHKSWLTDILFPHTWDSVLRFRSSVSSHFSKVTSPSKVH